MPLPPFAARGKARKIENPSGTAWRAALPFFFRAELPAVQKVSPISRRIAPAFCGGAKDRKRWGKFLRFLSKNRKIYG